MAPFDQTSILRGIDKEDIGSLRHIMQALVHRLAGVSREEILSSQGLRDDELQRVDEIFQLTRDRRNNILRTMVTRFATARYASPRVVISAAIELDELATEAVQTPLTRPSREYRLAENNFRQVAGAGPAVFDNNWQAELDLDADGNVIPLEENITIHGPYDRMKISEVGHAFEAQMFRH